MNFCIFPSCNCVNTTIWMHHIDANKKKARWKLLKNTVSYFEQIQEETPNKTAAVLPLTFHLKNYPSRSNKTSRILLEKRRSSTDHYR